MVKAKYIAVTQGKNGAFLINGDKSSRKMSRVCINQVIDKVGSGDALLALLSVCLV